MSLCLAVPGVRAQTAPAPSAPAAAAPARAAGASCLPRGVFAGPARSSSVEVLPDRRATFRFRAPAATEVLITSSDYALAIPMGFGGGPPGLAMTKDSIGLWTATEPRWVCRRLPPVRGLER